MKSHFLKLIVALILLISCKPGSKGLGDSSGIPVPQSSATANLDKAKPSQEIKVSDTVTISIVPNGTSEPLISIKRRGQPLAYVSNFLNGHQLFAFANGRRFALINVNESNNVQAPTAVIYSYESRGKKTLHFFKSDGEPDHVEHESAAK